MTIENYIGTLASSGRGGMLGIRGRDEGGPRWDQGGRGTGSLFGRFRVCLVGWNRTGGEIDCG